MDRPVSGRRKALVLLGLVLASWALVLVVGWAVVAYASDLIERAY